MTPLSNSFVKNQTVAAIDLTSLKENIVTLKKYADKSFLMAVVKTNAYGHGIIPIAKEAVEAGADRLGVTTVDEGVELREYGIKVPIQLLSPPSLEQVEAVVYYQLTASVSSISLAKAIHEVAVKQREKAFVHLEINTGLNRFGIEPTEASAFCQAAYHLSGLYWEGIYTHFSSADEGDWDLTADEFRLFENTVSQLKAEGFVFPIHHVGASTITIERKDMHLDMVRPGIAIFGYPPAPRQKELIQLKPVMTLKSTLLHVRSFPPNTKVGYGGEYVTGGHEKIGILPIGHGDGYKRALSNNGEVLIRGQRANIVGTISLDQTFLNVTEIPNVKEGDEVILIGKQERDFISARELANWINSNVDEILSSLMPRINRITHDR